MVVFGITGGSGSGKTSVSKMLENWVCILLTQM